MPRFYSKRGYTQEQYTQMARLGLPFSSDGKSHRQEHTSVPAFHFAVVASHQGTLRASSFRTLRGHHIFNDRSWPPGEGTQVYQPLVMMLKDKSSGGKRYPHWFMDHRDEFKCTKWALGLYLFVMFVVELVAAPSFQKQGDDDASEDDIDGADETGDEEEDMEEEADEDRPEEAQRRQQGHLDGMVGVRAHLQGAPRHCAGRPPEKDRRALRG